MKKILAALAFVAFFAFLLQPSKKLPFSEEAISYDLPFCPAWEPRSQTPEESRETEAALSQPYRFLSCGGQYYCFVSADDRYVIKFFKQTAFHVPEWTKVLAHKRMKKREGKRGRAYSSFCLSFDALQKETGLLYVHLNPTPPGRKITVLDGEGKEHAIDLGRTPFAVQRKAVPAIAYLDALMARGDSEGAKRSIDEILSLYRGLHRRGFENRDPNIRSNCGFVDGKAVFFDPGRVVSMKEMQDLPSELERVTLRLRRELEKKHPELLAYLEQALE